MNILKSSYSIKCLMLFAFGLTTLQLMLSTSFGDPLVSYLPKLPLMFLGYFFTLAILRGLSHGLWGLCATKQSTEGTESTRSQNSPLSMETLKTIHFSETLFYVTGVAVFIAAQAFLNT